MTCLLGDTNIFELYKDLTKKELSYQELLKEPEILSNLYYHLIRDGSNAIRIPSAYCSKNSLQKKNLADRQEHLLNLLVSSAKKTIEKTSADILNIGVISYNPLQNTSYFEEDLKKNIAEKTILLSDFGVDSIFVESVREWKILKEILLIISQQCSQPLVPFFAIQDFKKNEINDYLEIYEDLKLEMLGLELEPFDFISKQKEIKELSQKVELAVLLKQFTSLDSINLAASFLQKIPVTAVFGGMGTKRRYWIDFCQKYLH